MGSERGQAAVGLIFGAAVLAAALALLAGSLLGAAPAAWQSVVDERVRARERVLGTDLEMRPRWQRARAGANAR